MEKNYPKSTYWNLLPLFVVWLRKKK